ncbi:MFS transporter [Streptomyces sp. NPDC092296]|uniref:MFS transporter n=1 Tax=Streptomyces sp. NPDC092296 TaxID=3366012 RepID=UPI00382E6857
MASSANGRPAVPAEPDFRRFFIGYATSLFGSAMAPVAVAFAVLDNGGNGTGLGWVMAARILPIVLVLLAGGVIADRLDSKRVMLTADLLRCATQTTLAVLLLTGRPSLWTMAATVAVWGVGEGFFLPALGALTPELVRDRHRLSDANALLGLARSVATVAGPGTAGIVTAVWGPAAVLLADGASYAIGALALVRLSLPRRPAAEEPASLLADLREGWTEFRSRAWLWTTTAHMGLFNLLVWAPFLVLGPLTAQRRLGGAWAWGLVMAGYGIGAVAGGLAMLGRRPGRPLAVATVASLGWALPSAALAVRAPLAWTAVAALLAGVGSAVVGTLYNSVTQQRVPPDVLARISAFGALGAFVLGPVGLAAAGPVAEHTGASAVLAFGAGWQLVAAAAVLAIPAVRTLGALRPPDPVAASPGLPTAPGPEDAQPGRSPT